jgi:hypothetical protein
MIKASSTPDLLRSAGFKFYCDLCQADLNMYDELTFMNDTYLKEDGDPNLWFINMPGWCVAYEEACEIDDGATMQLHSQAWRIIVIEAKS